MTEYMEDIFLVEDEEELIKDNYGSDSPSDYTLHQYITRNGCESGGSISAHKALDFIGMSCAQYEMKGRKAIRVAGGFAVPVYGEEQERSA